MNNKILRQAETYRKTHTKKLWLYRGLSVIAAVAVFCTTYALILPAITMEKDPTCGIPEHTHTDKCYGESTGEMQFSCIGDLHSHSDDCYDADGNLICGYADFAVHTHSEICYSESGELICPLPEIKAHTHSEDCFEAEAADEDADTDAEAEEISSEHIHTDDCYTMQKGNLICTAKESEGHTHDDSCLGTVRGELICTEAEDNGHSHTDDCIGVISKTLNCEIEETEAHVHTEDCFETVITDELICTPSEDEAEEHIHTDECYKTVENCICSLETEVHTHTDDCYTIVTGYTCGLEESDGHLHSDLCYESITGNVCGLTEGEGHTHNDNCYEWNSVLSCTEGEIDETETDEADETADAEEPEENAERIAICGCEEIILHTHTEECYNEEGALVCGKLQITEHIHTADCLTESAPEVICGMTEHSHDEILCYIDETADIESSEDWEKTLPEELSGIWTSDLVSVASSQVGYTESKTNIQVNANGSVSHYSRYGAWYGRPYGSWDQTFISFCLSYAGIPSSAVPQTSDFSSFLSEASQNGILMSDDHVPQSGDIVLFSGNSGSGTGIVTSGGNTVSVIVGNFNGTVASLDIDAADISACVSVSKAAELYSSGDNSSANEDANEVNISIDSRKIDDKVLIILTAEFAENFDSSAYTWQWQSSEDGESDWNDIDSANDAEYSFVSDGENLKLYYRICGTKNDNSTSSPIFGFYSMISDKIGLPGFNTLEEDETDEDDNSYGADQIVSLAVTPIANAAVLDATKEPDKYYIYYYGYDKTTIIYTAGPYDADTTATPYTKVTVSAGYQWDSKWYLDSACTKAYDFSTPVSSMTDYLTGTYKKDLYLYPGKTPVWSAIFISGGSYVEPQILGRAEDNSSADSFNIDDVTKPTRSGYTFAGWYLDNKYETPATGTQTMPSDIADRNYTVYYYAKWNAGYVPFNPILCVENADDTDFVQESSLGTWYAMAGSTIKVETTKSTSYGSTTYTHKVYCELNGTKYPVYTSDPGSIDNTKRASEATLADVYNSYFVFNNKTDDWNTFIGSDRSPVSTTPVSSATTTVINFYYMRVRVDVTFKISNSGGYIDIYKLQQNGTLTGTVKYTNTTPTKEGNNVSASGTTAGGVEWTYTATSSDRGTNVYTLKNVKYEQTIADAYPVGGAWVTVRNSDSPFRYWGRSNQRSNTGSSNQTSRILILSSNYMYSGGRSPSANIFTAKFEKANKVALMYAIECLPGETADFTINGTGYKVATEYCEVVNGGSDWSAKQIAGCVNSINTDYPGVDQRYNVKTYYGNSVYFEFNAKNYKQRIDTSTAQKLFGTTYWDYYKNSISKLSDLDYAYIFYYNRERETVTFNFNYDKKEVSYTDILYGQNISDYRYAKADGTEHSYLNRDGYRFLGWKIGNSAVLTDEEWDNMVVSGNIVFTAEWEKISRFVVQYYETEKSTEPFEYHFISAEGGTAPYPEMLVYPDRWTYHNHDWQQDLEFTWDTVLFEQYGAEEQLTINGVTDTYIVIKIYGVWDSTKVKVAYDANESQGGIQEKAPTDSHEYEFGDTKVPVAEMGTPGNTDTSKKFVGWKLNKNGLVYQPGDHVAANWLPVMTFIAQWADEGDTVQLIYDPNGGTPNTQYNTDKYYAKGASTSVWDNVGTNDQPYYTRDGYEFIGWNTQADGNGTSYAPGSTITLNATTYLYAQWRPSTYTLVIEKYYNAASNSEKTYLAGATFELKRGDTTVETVTTGTDGKITISTKLDRNVRYTLVETSAPNGFLKLTSPIYFELDSEGKVTFYESESDTTGHNGTYGSAAGVYDSETRTLTVSVENKTGSELPHTGGMGTSLYTSVGLLIVGAAVILFMYNILDKKRCR